MIRVNSNQNDYQNLIELVQDRAHTLGDTILYTFIRDNLDEAGALSFADLHESSKALAALFLEVLDPGDRVLLLYPSGLEYIRAFFACLYAGMVAVPAYTIQSAKDHGRLNSIVQDSDAKIACTISDLKDVTEGWLEQQPNHKLRLICTDKINIKSAPSSWQCNIKRDDIAFLQYTSGSTGSPKGVMVSHGNLLHNTSLIRQGFGVSEEHVGASWLPPYHDMGLIGGVLVPLFSGLPVYLMSPMSFLKRPIRWLELIGKYGVTCTGGPNFGYDYCVKRINAKQVESLNLSSWEIAFNGAEPIRAESLKRFSQHFAAADFSHSAFMPCYGLAEATLYVCGSKKGVGPEFITPSKTALAEGKGLSNFSFSSQFETAEDLQPLVSSGYLGVEQCVILDCQSGEPCRDGDVGEILISSASVAKGYWKNPTATERTFAVSLPNDPRRYMRTGDLGCLIDGQLVVTGRQKELIIINGRNLYPQDIEADIQQIDERLLVGQAAAVSVLHPHEGTEKLVYIQEVQRKNNEPEILQELAERIRLRLLDSFQLVAEAIVLIAASSLPKTTSGKIQRKLALAQFQNKQLKCLYDSREQNYLGLPLEVKPVPSHHGGNSRLEVMRWIERIQTVVANYLPEGATANIQRPFQELGLDSKSALAIVGELEEITAKTLPPTLIFTYPTIVDLAQFLAGDEQAQSVAQTAKSDEPTALIGLACRFPGACNSEKFWQLMIEGGSGITEIPRDRWDWREHFNANGLPGYSQTQYGGFIDQVDAFDAEFFGISAKEARQMDPQQRLLLEQTWHALEDAGIVPSSLKEQRVGVYVGASVSDYGRLQAQTIDAVSGWAGTGNALSILANRLSYILGLQGPSITVDTACSSSLTALHLAKQGLQQGDCDLAIVAGVNLILSPELNVVFSQAGMLAPDGQCKTFSADADGYVRAEGCGVVVLKRLSIAQQNQDTIYAVVAGSAINQDGPSNGLTAPSERAQVKVMQQALHSSGVAPAQIAYVECHGTGTELGDPIELQALHKVYGISSAAKVRIASVKSNIGHLEAAAGIASLIKAALSLKHKTWIPSRNIRQLTAKFHWPESKLQVQNILETYADASHVAISGYGFGGSNAHVILSSAAPVTQLGATSDKSRSALITVSARHPDVLKTLVKHYTELLNQGADGTTLGYNSRHHRGHLNYRYAWRAGSTAALNLPITPQQRLPLCWMFTGQGSQYPGMGKKLYAEEAVFKDTLDACARLFDAVNPFPLQALLWGDQGDQLDNTRYTQPALFAIELALARQWQAWGLEPDAVLGHSVGEYAAACIAGVFSLEDGMRLILARGRLMTELCETGAMLSIWQTAEWVTAALQDYPDLNMAALNSPDSQVVSGRAERIAQLHRALADQGVRCKALSVSHGFHSQLMEPMLSAFREVAVGVEYQTAKIPFYSALLGRLAQEEIAQPEYWVRHVIEPVQFQAAVESAANAGSRLWLEIGPGHTLCGLSRQSVSSSQPHHWQPSLPAQLDADADLAEATARLYSLGCDFDWSRFDEQTLRPRQSLPLYPFRSTRFWLEHLPEAAAWQSLRDALGKRHMQAPQGVFYEQQYREQAPYDLRQHRISGRVLLCAANHISAFAEVLLRENATSSLFFPALSFHEPLFISANDGSKVQYQYSENDKSLQAFATSNDKNWLSIAVANSAPVDTSILSPSQPDIANLTWQSGKELYTNLQALGYEYGPAFQWLNDWARLPENPDGWQVAARIGCPEQEDIRQRSFTFPPGWLDSLFHMCVTLTGGEHPKHLYLPVSVADLTLTKPMQSFNGVAAVKALEQPSHREAVFQIAFWDSSGQCVISIARLSLKRVPSAWFNHHKTAELFALNWIEKPNLPRGKIYPETWQAIQIGGQACSQLAQIEMDSGIRLSFTEIAEAALPAAATKLLIYVAANANRADLLSVWQLLQQLSTERDTSLREIIVLAPFSLQENLQDSFQKGSEAQQVGLIPGWCRAFNNESLTLSCRLIDFDPHQTDHQALLNELIQETDETEVLLQGQRRLLPRWKAVAPQKTQRTLGQCALVTGASGDIGRRLLVFLAKSGVAEIVALSRSAVNAVVQQEVQALGCQLHWLTGNITEPQDLQQALQSLTDLSRPIDEIFHCAGYLKDEAFSTASWTHFEQIAAPKMDGALNLYQAITANPTLFAVNQWTLFSSIASATGSMGQAHYAASNAFLDRFAAQLRAQGTAAISINWGPWKGTSMVANAANSARMREEVGLMNLEPQHGFDMLLRIPEGPSQVICAVLDRAKFRLFPGVNTPAFTEMVTAEPTQKWQSFLQRLERSGESARRELMLSTLIQRTREALELSENVIVDPDQPLQQLGLDSLLAVELRNELSLISGKTLPATLLFDYPTLTAITQFLLGLMFGQAKDQPAAEDTTANLKVTDAELDAMLAEMMED